MIKYVTRVVNGFIFHEFCHLIFCFTAPNFLDIILMLHLPQVIAHGSLSNVNGAIFKRKLEIQSSKITCRYLCYVQNRGKKKVSHIKKRCTLISHLVLTPKSSSQSSDWDICFAVLLYVMINGISQKSRIRAI